VSRSHVVLLVVLLLAYNMNLRQVSSNDTYASRFVPISILRDGDLILDEFVPERIKQLAGDDFSSDYFHYTRGHFYDSHPPIGPLLAVPVYALPAWIGIPARPELVANLFSKIAASFMAALSALAVFGASRRLLGATTVSRPDDRDGDLDMRAAVFAAVAYGLGTSVWSTASLAIWTHTPAVLGYALALWALTANRVGIAGTAVAAAVLARPATAPAAMFLTMYLVHEAIAKSRWTNAVRFSVCAGVTGLAGLLYNYWLFGNAVGGAPFRTAYWMKELGTPNMFSGSLPAGFAGLTVSPSRGILIFSPIVLVAVAGAVRAWKALPIGDPKSSLTEFGRADAIRLLRYVSLAALAILLTYSKFIAWWGGHGYGPRYLTDAMPFVGVLFAAGFAPLMGSLRRWRPGYTAAMVLLSYSIFIQAVGAFCWPSPWTINNDPPYRYRLWDWRNNEIVTCIQSGPRIDPAAQRALSRIGF
jgi:hypothetical protein